jgi:acetyl esterase/lipase
VKEHGPVDEHTARQTIGEGTISQSGPNDSIQRFLGRGLFYLFCRQQGIWLSEVSSHDPGDQDWFADYQPIRNVSAEYPPTMLLHGEPDTDVLIEQSVLMQQEFIRHGVAHEFVRNPSWGHAFLYMPNDEFGWQSVWTDHHVPSTAHLKTAFLHVGKDDRGGDSRWCPRTRCCSRPPSARESWQCS